MSKANRTLFVIFVGLFVVLVIFNLQRNQNNSGQPQPSQKPEAKSISKFESRQNDEGNVIVVVRPVDLEPGKNPKFEIQFNTHSVDLSFDVSQIVTLDDDKGNIFDQPLWNGSPAGGHHRSGTLIFQKTLQKTKFVELVIKNVAAIPERKFRWDIN